MEYHICHQTMERITLYNTLTKKKELFLPQIAGSVSMYHCGPTVYNFVHIGNVRAFVVADTIRRLFEFNSYTVTQVMNITDIGHLQSDADDGEDKMTLALKREGLDLTLKTMRQVADRFYEAFRSDLKKVHILPAHIYPFASEHIEEDIHFISQLIAQNNAYITNDGVYFDTTSIATYGRLGQVSKNPSNVESRISTAIHADSSVHTKVHTKKNFRDFAVWKFNNEIGYEAPFGKGFPGWHIECSVMSMKYLGDSFDIHTGGVDHISIHHNNEIAQSEAISHKLLAHYWLHNEHVIIEGGKKMAKSGESFITLDELQRHDISPLGFRYWLLGASYRSPIQFSYEALMQAEQGYKHLILKIARLMIGCDFKPDIMNNNITNICPNPQSHTKTEFHILQFKTILNDDVNTAKAIAYLHEFILSHDDQNSLTLLEKLCVLESCDHALGLSLIDKAYSIKLKLETETIIPSHIIKLAENREDARLKKNWLEADVLRIEIEKQGFNIKDTSSGYEVEKTLL